MTFTDDEADRIAEALEADPHRVAELVAMRVREFMFTLEIYRATRRFDLIPSVFLVPMCWWRVDAPGGSPR